MVYKATKVLLLQTGGAARGGRHDKVMAVLPREILGQLVRHKASVIFDFH